MDVASKVRTSDKKRSMSTKVKFKTQFVNALKLFILLILLFWSFTWNSDPYFDLPHSKPRETEVSEFPKEVSSTRKDTSVSENKYSVLTEPFSAIRHSSRKSSKTASTVQAIIPPFNEWREIEMTKYEKHSSRDGTINHHKKTVQRKLNYASAKCGAKILVSNPEAKHRAAILNEKPDEYMLNPCRVKTWFVIELCDTVEATQVELVNYELYSSSPREFSVFWSEVFPTPVWHLLGTFEAKDERTMQTFHLNSKNLGKFIKVILYSHHGKEHYCLLSVIRVLGYSMVEKFEDTEEIDESNSPSALNNQSGMQFDRNSISEKEQIPRQDNKQESKYTVAGYLNEFTVKICAFYFTSCPHVPSRDFRESCPNKPICQFFMAALYKYSKSCDNLFWCRVNKMPLDTSNTTYVEKPKENNNMIKEFFPLNMKHENVRKLTRSTTDDILEDYESDNTLKQEMKTSVLNETGKRDENLKAVKWNLNISENLSNSKRFDKQDEKEKVHNGGFRVPTIENGQEQCICERVKTKVRGDASSIKEFEQDLSDIEKDVDSAGLIQKESVLFKLTTRIKTSEMDLSLINKYLQQLSQSYRKQMDDMQVMFNQTVKAIDAASEKATLIDERQQKSINTLQMKMISLTRKVDYLMKGHRDMLKRVFEMHAFFLILEFIIISTIFTIFLNIFHHKNVSIKHQLLDNRRMNVE